MIKTEAHKAAAAAVERAKKTSTSVDLDVYLQRSIAVGGCKGHPSLCDLSPRTGATKAGRAGTTKA